MPIEQRPLRFKGAPARLTAIIIASPQGAAAKAGRLVLSGRESLPLTIRVQSTSPTFAVLSFRLPKSTRPGSYVGSAEVGGAQIPVVIDVEARPRLRFYPPKVALQGAPGARLQVELTVLNMGNVDATFEPESTFCIFDDRGVDRAFYDALTEREVDGRRRIDRVMDEIAESHGGLVRAVVLRGAGRLAPEAAREVIIEFQFSHRMRPGQTYRGAWMISESTLEVEIKATNAVNEGAE
jgi:hypothetical protein